MIVIENKIWLITQPYFEDWDMELFVFDICIHIFRIWDRSVVVYQCRHVSDSSDTFDYNDFYTMTKFNTFKLFFFVHVSLTN